MTAPALTRSPGQMTAEAARILREVMQAEWPPEREAQWAIGWAVTYAHGWRQDLTALRCGEMDPYKVGDPDAAYWSDPDEGAQAFAADQFLQAAQAARKRLDEYVKREGEKP